MKRKLLITCAMLFAGLYVFSQDSTIVGWTFPNATFSDSFANLGITVNRIKALHLKSDSSIRFITKTSYSQPACAQAMGMSNATIKEKGWYLSFDATHYSDLKLSSRQQACPMHSGPKYWQIQYKLGTGTWSNVTNGNVVCTTSWVKGGVVTDLPLPVDCNNASHIELRWITTSDSNVAGPPNGTPLVSDSSMTRIDDIIITGKYVTGISENNPGHIFEVYPNPGNGMVNILTSNELNDLSVFNSFGQLIYSDKISGQLLLDLSKFGKGIFVIKIQNNKFTQTEKLIIQ